MIPELITALDGQKSEVGRQKFSPHPCGGGGGSRKFEERTKIEENDKDSKANYKEEQRKT